ncbi:fungal-specific transcription factor domain-containing protein [Dendryphion nanum]|uniref:Fungal-specific transcription factor domain-containing protein n=1 Tax=Dendryphion nanum TaxID=256645 RepID=A0A9P9ED55_9PLEO|nr:fungal-specific transcription factor domain-containing protein [Dendryphion nanum]
MASRKAGANVAPPPAKRTKLNSSADQETDGDQDGPACQSCRKRKAKCSRQQPCLHCLHINADCVYDEKKSRPGMRAGAIESLTRRLETLEHMFVGQGILLKPLLDRALKDAETEPVDVPVAEQLENLKDGFLRLAEARSGEIAPAPDQNLDFPSFQRVAPYDVTTSRSDSRALPPQLLNRVIDWYFDHIHPWIPILHVSIFRAQLRDPTKAHQYKIVLDAIVSACLRFQLGALETAAEKEIALNCRHAVILGSMEKFSVESLQALVIVAFDIIGSGRGPSAWSVVGSMTRTVEQLRLSVEEDDDPSGEGFLIRRMTFLRKPESWAETEERRRVFWNVFLMDRFCSIATGWNNSLTSADVRRRLPCEGALWQAGNPVRTPLFGIAGRSSNSQQALTPSSEQHSVDDEELKSIGGFAFCIEATENLNLVTSFFLQHPVAFHDAQEMQLWLMRFKELDLRLVKWRLFLPPRWRNASVLNPDGIMDPNLTLAHMTHNTAIIQLHQSIAYPAPQLRACPVALPSIASAETCVAAASEISTIADQFLQQSTGITNPQFSFCLFIAGRVLLAHATYYSEPLDSTSEIISSSLVEVGRRWAGRNASSATDSLDNLASRFSRRLERAKQTMHGTDTPSDPILDIRQPVYSGQTIRSRATSVTPIPPLEPGISSALIGIPEHQSPDSISLAFPPLPFSFENVNEVGDTSFPERFSAEFGDQGLDLIFDDEYQQMLRVSTFAEANGIARNT